MKKALILLSFAGILSNQCFAADLLGAMHKATAKVDSAQAKVDATKAKADAAKDSAGAPDEAAVALLKSKLTSGKSNKADVKKLLGEPASVSGEPQNEVWTYTLSSVNKTAGQAAAVAEATGKANAGKTVNLTFNADVLSSYSVGNAH